VAEARSRLDEKQAQAEALLKRLEEGEASLAVEQARIRDERQELDAARERQKDEERALVLRKTREVDVFARELRQRGEEAARRAADAIQQAVRRVEMAPRSVQAEANRARTAALAEIRAAQDEVLADPALGLAAEVETPAALLAIGGRVKVKTLGVTGEIVAFHGDGKAELAVGGKRLRVSSGDLVPVAGGGARPAPGRGPSGGAFSPRTASDAYTAPGTRASTPERGEAEINLVGLTVDEAIPRVDKALDEAAVADRHQLRVIHGFGEGRLRRAVAGLLQGHPHVAAFRAGASREGGGGVTIVELKE
jgi:DNA mismatch repair protein MutS2